MTMNPLPPQAYTKDTLLRAYHWVQTQPPTIKELAMTPDILVSLYLKTVRDGDQSLERPSIQNFKTELKSLAGLMGELEEKPAPRAQAPAGASAAARTAQKPAAGPSIPLQSQPPLQPQLTDSSASAAMTGLDEQSLDMLREIQSQFNLSSEAEALRMLIKIGYSRARTLFTGV